MNNLYLRRALRMAIGMFIGVLLYHGLDLLQGFWVILTLIITMQATTAATLRKGLQRFVGTLLGILIGYAIISQIQNLWIIDSLLVVFLFLAYWLKAFNLVNYGIFVIPLTIMVVFLFSAIVPSEITALTWARLYDSSIGIVLGMLVTFLILPNSIKPILKQHLKQLKKCGLNYLQALIDFAETGSETNVEQHHLAYLNALSKNRELFADWRYETLFSRKLRQHYFSTMQGLEHYVVLLAALHHLLRQNKEGLTVKQLMAIKKDFAQHPFADTSLAQMRQRLGPLLTEL